MAVDTGLIKRPHKSQTFTKEQMLELAQCMADPKYFALNHCYIQHPTKGRMKFDLYDYQKGLIDVYHNHRYSIAMLPRQTGKSTCAAAYLLWYAMFKPDSTILIAAHKYSGAQEIMQRIRYMYETCPDHIRAGVTAYNKGSLEFDNGSRIIAQATTDNTGRGLSLTLVYLDEFAFVQPRIAQEFWTSLSPTLSTGGKCFITSTPNQDDDQFARIWKDACKTLDEYGEEQDLGKNGFKSFQVHWSEHPERDDAWAISERAKIGEERFRREHECEFIAWDETLINSLKLPDLEGIEPKLRQGQVRWYSTPNKGHTYIVGLDPSLGTGGDNAAIQVFSLPGLEQVAEWQHNKTPVQKQIRIMFDIIKYINDQGVGEIYWSVENNTLGEAALVAINEFGEDKFPGTFLSEPKRAGNVRRFRKGFTTTHRTKLSSCAKFKQWIETDHMKVRSKNLVREIKTFVARGNSYAAKEGETDDLVMATILCTRMIQSAVKFDENAFNMLNDIGPSEENEDVRMPMPIGMI